jgi:hypothetical protein
MSEADSPEIPEAPESPDAPEEPDESGAAWLVPELDLGDARGVTEIRVHGVGGATPDSMLDVEQVRQVAGDRVSGFYRPCQETPGRHLEAYSWGGFTSRSHARALWVFLLPFMLSNLAGWTSAPRKKGPDTAGPVHGFRLAAAKWGALALTLSVLMTFSLILVDAVAYQCGAQAGCAGSAWWLAPLTWADLPENPAHRVVLGGLLMAAILTVFAVLSYTSRRRYEAVEPPFRVRENRRTPPASGASAAYLPGGLANDEFWSGKLAHTRLSRLHLAAGFAAMTTVTALCTMHIDERAPDDLTATLRGLALVVAGVVAVLATVGLGLDGLKRLAGRRPWPSAVVLALALAGFAVAVVAGLRQGPPPRLLAGQTPGMTAAFNAVWVLVTALLLPLAVSTVRPFQRRLQKDRDGIGRIPPYAATSLGIILAQVVLLSLLIFVASRLSGDMNVRYQNLLVLDPGAGRQPIVLPPLVPTVTAYFVWGIAALLAVALLWLASALLVAYRRGESDGGESAEDYAEERKAHLERPEPIGERDRWTACAAVDTDEDGVVHPQVTTSWTRWRAVWKKAARSSVYVSRTVNVLAAAATTGLLLVWLEVLVLHQAPPDILVGPAVAVALFIPPALVVFVAGTWRNLERRRVIGSLWDVGTFWPRSFHPFAPPCYAERAVPELTRRVWWLNDGGGEVLLAAHSQGSVIAAATGLRSDLRNGTTTPRFGLVTYGAPLRKLYRHAFPAYWPDSVLTDLADPQRSLVLAKRWRNVYYLTDYIGGPVGMDAVDWRLPDPQSSLYVWGQPTPRVRSHTGYATDPRFREIVDRAVGS